MSLPSVEFLKDQANRLVSYMGDKHRIRLKAASALEAIAALYKQRDWNTLQALSRRADEDGSYASAASNPNPRYLTPTGQYPLTWTAGRIGYAVPERDWFRHTLACGGTPEDRNTWLQQHLMAHLDRNGAGVFINAFGGKMPESLIQAIQVELADQVVLLDLSRPGVSEMAVNLLADLEPEAVAAMLLRLLPSAENSPGADFYRHRAHQALTVLATVLAHLGMPITLSAMMHPWRDNGKSFTALLQRCDPDSAARQHLQRFLEAHATPGGNAFEFGNTLGGLLGRLALLASEPWAPLLFSDKSTAVSLSALLLEGKCVIIEGAYQSAARAGQAEQLVAYALSAAVRIRRDIERADRDSGWVFGFGQVANYLSPAFAVMASQASAARIALLMTATACQDLSRHPQGESLLANVWNQLYLGGLGDAKIAEIVQELKSSTVALCQPGAVQW